MRPGVRRQLPGSEAIAHADWLDRRKGVAQATRGGCEAAVEAHREHGRVLSELVEQLVHGGELVEGQTERFLDEDVFAAPERAHDQLGVRVVASHDEDRVGLPVFEDFLGVRGGVGEPLALGGTERVHAMGGAKAAKPYPRHRLECGK